MQVTLLLGAIIPILVLITAIVLLRTGDQGEAPRAQIGRPLLVGGILGLAFIPTQLATQSELRDQSARLQHADARLANHRDLLLQLSLRTDLRGIDLRGQDLAGSYLIAKDLAGANLRGANLAHADLAHADLRGADLTRTRLNGATLTGARFDRAKLADTSFVGADLRHARFRTIDWRGGTHPGPLLFAPEPNRIFVASRRATRQRRASVSADFSGANLAFASFARSDLSFARFERASLRVTTFNDVILQDADFKHALMIVIFNRVDLCRSSLNSSSILDAAFIDVNLRLADLRGLSIMSAGFSDVDFRGARAKGLRHGPVPGLGVPQRIGPLVGFDRVVLSVNAPELPLDISRSLGASRRKAMRRRECSWGLFGNRLEPLAAHAPPPRST